MSNEVKVALLAIVAIALSYWGFKFIQGKNILKNSNLYYVSYDSIDGMARSVPVRIKGFEVGFVSEIRFAEDYRTILVTLDLNKEIKISKNTTASITADGIMGGKYIELHNSICSGADCAESGSFLKGETKSLLASMVGEQEFRQYFSILSEGINELVDSLSSSFLSGDGESGLGKTMKSLESTVANFESSSRQLDQLLRKSGPDIASSLEDLSLLTKTLAENNDKIKSILDNTDKMTADLAGGELKQTLEQALAAVQDLRGMLKKADGMVASFSTLADGINQGQGTLGKLMKDEQMYEQLVSTMGTLDSLLEALNDKPYRFVPFKNRKKVLRYDRQDAKLENEN